MKQLLTILLLAGTALAQGGTTSSNIYPSTTGLDLGKSTQRWDIFAQDVDVRGNLTCNGKQCFYTQGIDVFAYGAVGDGVADDTAAINNAIAAAVTTCSVVYLQKGIYKTTAPITLLPCSGYQLGGMVKLRGAGEVQTIIRKSTNTVGTTAATKAPSRTWDDTFAVDSIITVAHAADSHSYYAEISDLALEGFESSPNWAGIYAPRFSQLEVKNVHGKNFSYGFVTYDGWMSRFTNVRFDMHVDAGFAWLDDSSDQSTGTSIAMDNVYVRSATTNCFYISRLSYSSFNNTGCDRFNAESPVDKQNPTQAGYYFEKSEGITLNGMGAESNYGSMLSAVNGSTVTVNGGKSFDMHQRTSAGTVGYIYVSGSKLTINSSTFQALSGSGNFYNLVLQDGGTLILNNTAIPSGGNGFVSYSGGSVLIENNNNGVKVTTGAGSSQFSVSGMGLFTGGVQLAATADVLTWFKKATHASLDLASVASADCSAEQAETIIGAVKGDHCEVDSPTAAIPAKTSFSCRVDSDNTIKWQYCNQSGAPVDLDSGDYTIRVVR